MSERAPDQLVTIDRLAELWVMSPELIRRYIREESLPSIKFGTASQSPVRIRLSDAEAWLAARQREVADAPTSR